MNNRVYLGDSVYAEYDGYHIILTTNNGYSDDPRNRIALEPAVFANLLGYKQKFVLENTDESNYI